MTRETFSKLLPGDRVAEPSGEGSVMDVRGEVGYTTTIFVEWDGCSFGRVPYFLQESRYYSNWEKL